MQLIIDKKKYFFELGLLKMHGFINEDLMLTELGMSNIEGIRNMLPQLQFIIDIERNELRIS